MRSSIKEGQTSNTNFNEPRTSIKNENDYGDTASTFKSTNQFDNMKVAIRVRPALPREMEPGLPFRSIVKIKIISLIRSLYPMMVRVVL